MIEVGADLRPTIEKALDSGPRGDELYPHISDLGFCDLSTWARRQGKPQLGVDAATLWKWALGHDVEARVADAILTESKGAVRRGDRIAWDPWDFTVRDLLEPAHRGLSWNSGRCEGCTDCLPGRTEIVGHLDLLQLDKPQWVGEVKSVWFAREAITEPKPGHAVQAAGYATALGIDDFFVQYVTVTITGRRTELRLSEPFWRKTEEFRDWIVVRSRAVIELRNGAFPPEAKPPEEWQCRYCRYGGCMKNINPMRKAK